MKILFLIFINLLTFSATPGCTKVKSHKRASDKSKKEAPKSEGNENESEENADPKGKNSAKKAQCPFKAKSFDCTSACMQMMEHVNAQCYEKFSVKKDLVQTSEDMFAILVTYENGLESALAYCSNECAKQSASMWSCLQAGPIETCDSLTKCNPTVCN
jgi:hypothetical protein